MLGHLVPTDHPAGLHADLGRGQGLLGTATHFSLQFAEPYTMADGEPTCTISHIGHMATYSIPIDLLRALPRSLCAADGARASGG